MLKVTQWFVERLLERLVPILGGLVTTAVETVAAVKEAEQQDLIEEQARRYEADGKTEISEALRRRAAKLTHDNPGASALPMIGNLADDCTRVGPFVNGTDDGSLPELPDLTRTTAKSKTRKNRS